MSTFDTVLPRLMELICDLYDDSDGFLERTDDAQLWYNRGYANGMIEVLAELGYEGQITSLIDPDAPDLAADQALLPWGKAYRHGCDMGRRETREVMGVC